MSPEESTNPSLLILIHNAKSITHDSHEENVMTGDVSTKEHGPDKDTSSQVANVGPLFSAFVSQTDTSKHGKFYLPSSTSLRTKGFGKPSLHHSYHVRDNPLDNVLIFLFKGNCLVDRDRVNLRKYHTLYYHLWTSLTRYRSFNFTSLRKYDINFSSQSEISLISLNAR